MRKTDNHASDCDLSTDAFIVPLPILSEWKRIMHEKDFIKKKKSNPKLMVHLVSGQQQNFMAYLIIIAEGHIFYGNSNIS